MNWQQDAVRPDGSRPDRFEASASESSSSSDARPTASYVEVLERHLGPAAVA